jgi:membrane protein insertase Oxa1/YidC/SpoIIIJ
MLLTANIFQPLIDVFEAVLKFFHNSLGVPWGWAIVLLTVVIRLALLPLTVKQFHSMQQLQRHQPELKAIQAKYKDDKARQQEEMMKFYKENNVNRSARACRWSRSCRCSSRCSTCCATACAQTSARWCSRTTSSRASR